MNVPEVPVAESSITIETMTEDVSCVSCVALPEIVELADKLASLCRDENLSLLAANQIGRRERVLFVAGSGRIANLDVIPVTEEGFDESALPRRAVRVVNETSRKILVPIYPKLQVEFVRIPTGEKVKFDSTKEKDNLIWWAAEIILNGAVQWCAPDYGILRAEKKIGPNERCECGSGKKHKKCCGR
jgi:hypothetical protein